MLVIKWTKELILSRCFKAYVKKAKFVTKPFTPNNQKIDHYFAVNILKDVLKMKKSDDSYVSNASDISDA